MASAPVQDSTIRVAVRSGRRLFRDALAANLRARPEYDVVGHVACLEDMVALCDLSAPDVALIDVDSGLEKCANTFARLAACAARARIVVVYDQLTPAETAALLRLGVDGFVPCSHGLDALLVVLRRYLGVAGARARQRAAEEGLTGREREILTLVSAGHTAEQIGAVLDVSASSVENAKRRIHQKLNVASQSQAVARAAALGIVAHPLGNVIAEPITISAIPELTARECDILLSISQGDTVRQTARALGIAEKTVENTQARLFRKLGARNRCGALSAAHALGLLERVSRPTRTP